MNTNWSKVYLQDVASEITVGFVGSMTKEYQAEGIPFLRSLNVNRFRINNKDLRYVSKEFHKKISKSRLTPGDVVIVRTGKPGTAAVIPDDLSEANCSDLVIVRCGEKIDNKFLCYFLNSTAIAHINAHLVGAVQQHFNVSSARTLEINLPPLNEQKGISNILGTIDKKIVLNKKNNETLEEIAKRIFKSWFIDFDPVIAKVEGLSTGLPSEISNLFPDSFENFNFDKIPQSWEVSKFGKLCTPKRGKVITKKTIIPGEIPVVAGGINPAYYHSKSNASSPVVTISSSGNAGYVNLFYKDIWASDCSYINKNVTDFIYFSHSFLKVNQSKIFHLRHGAVQQHINPNDLMELDLVLPPLNLINHYEQIVTPLHNKISSNLNEINTLSNMRDILLPKLISGELRIPDAEKMIEEIGI